MEHYLIIARSITQAQRIEATLERVGIHAQIFRASGELTNLGCAYAVQIPEASLSAALNAMHQAKLNPIKIYLSGANGYREAGL